MFTDTLLARLEADECAAICAHEISHLEHFNPRRLRRLNLITYALIEQIGPARIACIAFDGSCTRSMNRQEGDGPLLAHRAAMPWEILLGRALALCVHPAAAWRLVSARGRAAIFGAYFGAGYAAVLAALLAL